MEEAITVLKKIGVKEINKTTKISVGKIEDILEKRFSNLQRVRVVGFLKILEREYRVDLSGWLKEYDENFFSGMQIDESIEDIEHSVNNLDFDTQKQKDDLIKERKKQLISKKRFYISLIVVLVVLGGYFAYKTIFMKSSNISKDMPLTQQEDMLASSQDEIVPKEDENKLQEEKSDVDLTEDTSESTAEDAPVKTQKKYKNQILVTPDHSLWIEVFDLDSKQKFQTTIDAAYPIEVKDHKLLISFGHGEFSLETDAGVVRYEKSYPIRFLYTPETGLKRIRYAQYLKLSGQDQ
ncbi:hypothetical protein BKH41_08305 [Helicobacter sp. 12S02232-10]|uniref:hypothetical protein n=1 Tax=Helicobacter sp. 12S02232-10 TaxID=1476197 RepID=UPI000BA6F23C|nr:hypothetical protein [Helicobacter sp. 12S02232-10]PAF47017.1 hypothetical protein BKH41_08305 [Helicobacter sp. 12S02232-10]